MSFYEREIAAFVLIKKDVNSSLRFSGTKGIE